MSRTIRDQPLGTENHLDDLVFGCPKGWRTTNTERWVEQLVVAAICFIIYQIGSRTYFKSKGLEWRRSFRDIPQYVKYIMLVLWLIVVGHKIYVKGVLDLLFCCYMQFNLTVLVFWIDVDPSSKLGQIIRVLLPGFMWAPVVTAFLAPTSLLFLPGTKWAVWLITHPIALITQSYVLRMPVFTPLWENPVKECTLVVITALLTIFLIVDNISIATNNNLNFVQCPPPALRTLCTSLGIPKNHARKLICSFISLVIVAYIYLQMALAKLEDYLTGRHKQINNKMDLSLAINVKESSNTRQRNSLFLAKTFFVMIFFALFYAGRVELNYNVVPPILPNPVEVGLPSLKSHPGLINSKVKMGSESFRLRTLSTGSPNVTNTNFNELGLKFLRENENKRSSPVEMYGMSWNGVALKRTSEGNRFSDSYAYFKTKLTNKTEKGTVSTAIMFDYRFHGEPFLIGFTQAGKYYGLMQNSFNPDFFVILENEKVKVGYKHEKAIIAETKTLEGLATLSYTCKEGVGCEFALSSRGTTIFSVTFEGSSRFLRRHLLLVSAKRKDAIIGISEGRVGQVLHGARRRLKKGCNCGCYVCDCTSSAGGCSADGCSDSECGTWDCDSDSDKGPGDSGSDSGDSDSGDCDSGDNSDTGSDSGGGSGGGSNS